MKHFFFFVSFFVLWCENHWTCPKLCWSAKLITNVKFSVSRFFFHFTFSFFYIAPHFDLNVPFAALINFHNDCSCNSIWQYASRFCNKVFYFSFLLLCCLFAHCITNFMCISVVQSFMFYVDDTTIWSGWHHYFHGIRVAFNFISSFLKWIRFFQSISGNLLCDRFEEWTMTTNTVHFPGNSIFQYVIWKLKFKKKHNNLFHCILPFLLADVLSNMVEVDFHFFCEFIENSFQIEFGVKKGKL